MKTFFFSIFGRIKSKDLYFRDYPSQIRARSSAWLERMALSGSIPIETIRPGVRMHLVESCTKERA